MLFVGERTGTEKFPVPVAEPTVLDKAEAVRVVVEAAEPDADADEEGEEPAPLDFTPESPELEPVNPGLETPHCGLYWYSPVPSTTS
jgi:hypothetical protein